MLKRSVRVGVGSARVIRLDREHLFIELVLTNRSSLPFSLTAVRVWDRFRPVLANSTLRLLTNEYTKSAGGEIIERTSWQIATDLPCLVDPYTSRRIVLQFRCRPESYRFLRSLPRRSGKLALELCTSRGRRLRRCRFSVHAFDAWIRPG